MNKRIITTALALLSVAGLSGCLERDFSEKEALVEISSDETGILQDIVVQAELPQPEVIGDEYISDITKTILIKSNRSWSVVLDREASYDWIDISVPEYINLAQYTQEVPLTLTFKRNKTLNPRHAVMRVCFPEGYEEYNITQEGNNYMLSVDDPDDPMRYTTVDSIVDTVDVAVRCNTVWTAEVVDGAADVTLLPPDGSGESGLKYVQGEDNAILKVVFGENFDMSEKFSTIRISAQDSDPGEVNVDFTQVSAVPSVRFPKQDTTIPEWEGTYGVKFRSNVPWTVSIKDNEGFESLALSPSGGERTPDGTVTMSFVHGGDPGIHKSVTLLFAPEGGEAAEITLMQTGSIHLDFMDVKDVTDPTYDETKPYRFKWPFSSPPLSDFPSSVSSTTKVHDNDRTECITSLGSFHFFVNGKRDDSNSGGIWYNSPKQGFLFGKVKIESYMEFPALDGLTLVKVIHEPSWLMACKLAIRSINPDGTSGAVVEGGEERKGSGNGNNVIPVDSWKEHYEFITYNLVGTTPGTAYRLSLEADGGASTKELILVYE